MTRKIRAALSPKLPRVNLGIEKGSGKKFMYSTIYAEGAVPPGHTVTSTWDCPEHGQDASVPASVMRFTLLNKPENG